MHTSNHTLTSGRTARHLTGKDRAGCFLCTLTGKSSDTARTKKVRWSGLSLVSQAAQAAYLYAVFSKTLFTPAGIDVYVRPLSGQNPDTPKRQALVDRIVDVVKRNEDDGIKTLSKDGFGVPGVL